MLFKNKLFRKFFICALVTSGMFTSSEARDLKIGHQIYSVYPISISGGRVVDSQIIPAGTVKLIEDNIADDGTVIIRDRLVLGYFTGTRFIQGLLTDHILFTCRGRPCNPTGKTVTALNEKTFSYVVGAENLSDWFSLIELLQKSTEVKAVFPTFINDARGKFTISDVHINGVMEKKFYYDQEHRR